MSGIGYIDHGVGCLDPDIYEARYVDIPRGVLYELLREELEREERL